MPETDKHIDEGTDDLDTESRVNFRDYPSSGMVVIAAISSGLGWMLYRWLGRKRRTRSDAAAASTPASVPPHPAEQPADRSS